MLITCTLSASQIFSIIQEEEASFSRTLLKGIERYKKAAAAARAGAPPALRLQRELLHCTTSHPQSVCV
jgi:alanyl-tRNA synthetase